MKNKKRDRPFLFSGLKNDAIRSEVQQYFDIRRQRRWIFPRAALVGVCAGAVALLFRMTLTSADALRNELIARAHHYRVWGWIFPVLFTMVGAGLAAVLMHRFSPESGGSGIPHLEAVLQRFRKLEWKRVLPVKFFGGLLAIGGGLALGREGPTVQMGGAVGDALSRGLKASPRERLVLISAGAGAGLSAAFNAPLSGLVFVLEEIRRDFQPVVFGAVFLAAAIADIVARIGTGQFPVFAIPAYASPPLISLPVFALLGVICGGLGVLFNRSLLLSMNLYDKLAPRFVLPVIMLTGGVIGLAGWFFPALIGSGNELAEAALNGKFLLRAIPVLFIARFALTTVSYGAGVPGGIFAPLLVLGALLGLAVGQAAHRFAPDIVPVPVVFAGVGMAAYFAAIVRAPLTGVMLVTEMTGNYSQMLPLLISCFCAYAVAEALKDTPIYEALLERDLELRGTSVLISEPAVVEFVIEANSPFAGLEVRSLGLPSGCILVRCADGKREWVPKATTRLKAHMRITAVISPEASVGLEILRNGCRAA